MKLSFRQGLISGSAYMLTPAISRSDYVSLDASQSPIYLTIAHGSSDYLVKFDSLVEAAWGSIPQAQDSVLYIEIDTMSGEVVFGITDHEPLILPTEPDQAPPGKMWFDLTRAVMRVRSPDGARWTDRPRCILGKVVNGSMNQITTRGFGSAVGLNVSSNPGYILFDIAARPLRTPSGEFLTSETNIRMKTSSTHSAALVNPVSNFVPVRAAELIPEMSLVYLSGPDRISLASSSAELSLERAPIGIVQQTTGPNEDTIMALAGEIAWPNWAWPSDSYGKSLYCGLGGELTTERPRTVQVFRVGRIKNHNTVLFAIDSETETQVVSTAKLIVEGVSPVVVQATTTALGENVAVVSMPEASGQVAGYISPTVFAHFEASAERADTAFQAITVLNETKAENGHTHGAADIDGLTSVISDIIHTIDASLKPVVGATLDNFVSFGDNGSIKDSGITPESFANVDHQHTIADIDDLQMAINGFATSTHTHGYLEINGLPDALDERAYAQHTHAQINIVGLVPALEDRAMKRHTHELSEIGGFDVALTTKLDIANTTPFDSIDDYNPASKKYVDDSVAGVTAAATTVTTAVDGLMATIDMKLSPDNTTAFEPQSNYNPTSKKYVDDGIATATAPILSVIADLENRTSNLEIRADTFATFTNTQTFEPQDDYNVATKKYVDVTVQTLNGGGTIVVAPDVAPLYRIRKDPAIVDIGSSAHHNGYFVFTSGADITLTVRPDSHWSGTETYTSVTLTDLNASAMPIGGWVVIGKRGAGNIIFDAPIGVQMKCAQSALLNVLDTKMTLIKTDVDEWDLILNNF